MINVQLKRDDETAWQDTYSVHGLIYVESDTYFGAPAKKFEKTSYADEPGEHVYNVVALEAFDYKVTFAVEVPKSATAYTSFNKVVTDFNKWMGYAPSATSATIKPHRVGFQNLEKGVQVFGIPMPITNAEEFWYNGRGKEYGCVIVEWTIRVDDPTKCKFNL